MFDGDLTDEECPRRNEYDADVDCRGDEVCAKVGGCCEPKKYLCAAPCGKARDSRSSRSATSVVLPPILGR